MRNMLFVFVGAIFSFLDQGNAIPDSADGKLDEIFLTALANTPEPVPVIPNDTNNNCQVYLDHALLTFTRIDDGTWKERFELKEISCPYTPSNSPFTLPTLLEGPMTLLLKILMLFEGNSCDNLTGFLRGIFKDPKYSTVIDVVNLLTCPTFSVFTDETTSPQIGPTAGEVCEVNMYIDNSILANFNYSMELTARSDGSWVTDKAWCGAKEPGFRLNRGAIYDKRLFRAVTTCDFLKQRYKGIMSTMMSVLTILVKSKGVNLSPEIFCKILGLIHGEFPLDIVDTLRKIPLIGKFLGKELEKLEDDLMSPLAALFGWQSVPQ